MWGRDTGGSELADSVAAQRRLRETWGRRSRGRRGGLQEDWWSPAVDAVCTAAVRGSGLAEACGRLGQARARAGMPVGEALDDLAALCDALGRPQPPIELVTALAEGWVDGGRCREDCRDPLTGLTTAAYLRTRLTELYRGGGPGGPHGGALGHRFVVVALPAGLDPWRRTARLIVLGHELGRFFSRGETLALLSRSRLAVLAPAATNLQERLRRLEDDVCAEHGACVRSRALPSSCAEALALIDDPGRAPMSGE
ncbi:hypothetical protein [Streptomonospora litoralis]|uniref:Uncharacterized protein n=1 Tax=Streptomonospora litoralis TaxID=2498135 RepID=A0A4P6Q6W8_9ACTN|nr:hypothetical protein [Streptomonospora litoralis]QBI56528.1 hypothetical protein EKD16_23910 [Streptomonospora litoralis]